MLLRPTFIHTTILSLFTNSTYCLFSTTTKIPLLSKIPFKHRPRAIQQAQEAITDYLHSTRSFPLVYAENIVKNASFSLSSVISKIPFKHSTFLNSLQRFLRYHPINEFQFFYESIGLDCTQIKARLPVDKLFLSEDLRVFSVACVLADFGFPWNKLGLLCNEKGDVFSSEHSDLRTKLSEFKDRYGFSNAVAVGICFAFPDVLSGLGERDALLSELKRVLLNTDLVKHVKGNVDGSYEVCRKIKLFYELGCKKGEVGELLAVNHNIFGDYEEDDLVRKIYFFCRLGVDEEQVGLLLLSKSGILKFDLGDHVISVLSFLKHFSLNEENLKHIEQNYPYVLGKNWMVNLPHIIRAMDLSEWFFNTIKHGDHSLLETYGSSDQGEDADDDYRNNHKNIPSKKYPAHNTSKLDFLHGIGFGENRFTTKVARESHGSGSQFYERFNLLLSLGIKFSKLCKMIWLKPQILNASSSLSSLITQIPFQPSTFFDSMQRFIRYHPINEFEFFYESIGIDYKEHKSHLPVHKLFSQDSQVFRAACALVDFGFPWNKLGMLCTEKVDIFRNEDCDLRMKISELKDYYGVNNAAVVGICLAFPRVLAGFGESDDLLSDLKRVLLNTNLVKHMKGNVDDTYGVCRKIKLFYELCCMKGNVIELLAMNHNIFIDYPEDDLVRKIDFFCRLGVVKEQAGLLLLSKPGILKFDLEDREISVLSLLKHFNLSEENLKHIEQNYPYVLGKNKMVNLPHIMRAMDLSEWFFNTIKFGDHSLLATYARSNQDEDEDDIYRNNFQKILSGGSHVHTTNKLDFLHSIGFGENKFTMKAMPELHGSCSQLYERFNNLLSLGIKFSKLCKMIRIKPRILNQNTYLVERKVKFLCKEMGFSLDYLGQFPAYLMYDFENRIKPRFRFHMWLKAQGWCKIEYSVCTIIAPTEKHFIATISNIHPDAPKKWLEFQKEIRKQVAEKSQST